MKDKHIKSSLFVLLFALVNLAKGQYEIPSYYGFWSKRFYQPAVIMNGSFTVFEMHFSIDVNYDGTIAYYADSSQHCIFSYNLTSKKYSVIAGKCSLPGDRVGSAMSSYFYGPSSVTYWRPDSIRASNATKSTVYLVRSETCSLESSDCQITDVDLASYEDSLTLKNIRLSPSYDLFSINPESQDEYLFIADRLNHCIKKITLKTKYTEVVAGLCGMSGFLDGPLGFNLLNLPSNLGIDPKGVLYFFDEGNEYIRKVGLDGNVGTLLNGACTEYIRSNEKNRRIKNFQLNKMICYENWIQKKTASSTQHYFNEDLLNICTEHSSKCPSQVWD